MSSTHYDPTKDEDEPELEEIVDEDPFGIGHNEGPELDEEDDELEEEPKTSGGVAADRLISFVDRISRLEEDRANLNADIREVVSEAKVAGFDAKTVREMVKIKKKDPTQFREEEHLRETYLRAIGIW